MDRNGSLSLRIVTHLERLYSFYILMRSVLEADWGRAYDPLKSLTSLPSKEIQKSTHPKTAILKLYKRMDWLLWREQHVDSGSMLEVSFLNDYQPVTPPHGSPFDRLTLGVHPSWVVPWAAFWRPISTPASYSPKTPWCWSGRTLATRPDSGRWSLATNHQLHPSAYGKGVLHPKKSVWKIISGHN